MAPLTSIPGGKADDLQSRIAERHDDLMREAAKLGRDPYRHLIEGLAETLVLFGAASSRMEAAVAQQRPRTVDQEIVRQTVRQTIADYAPSILGAHSLRTALLAGWVGLGLLAAGAAGGWWYGRQQTATETLAIQQEIHRTSDEIAAAALKAGRERAALWRDLIDWNADIRQALSYRRDCASNDGRTGCLVPLWVAPPPSDPPLARNATSH